MPHGTIRKYTGGMGDFSSFAHAAETIVRFYAAANRLRKVPDMM